MTIPGEFIVTEDRGESSFFSVPDRLVELLRGSDFDARRKRLQPASLSELLKAFQRHIGNPDEYCALLVGEELCHRSIAPVFRLSRDPSVMRLPDSARVLLRMADLQWLRHRYPDHHPAWEKLAGVFHRVDVQALKAWRYVTGIRSWQLHHTVLLKGLGVSDTAPIELAVIVPANLQRRRQTVRNNRERAFDAISSKMDMSRDRRSGEERDATLKRRQILWRIGTLCAWSPQQTANLYACHPDRESNKEISRGSVARDIEFISSAVREYPRRPHVPSSTDATEVSVTE